MPFITEFIAWYKSIRHRESNTPERIKQDADMAFYEENDGEHLFDGYKWIKVLGKAGYLKITAEFYRKNADAMSAFYHAYCSYEFDDDRFLDRILFECKYPTTTINADKDTTAQPNQQAPIPPPINPYNVKVTKFAYCLYHVLGGFTSEATTLKSLKFLSMFTDEAGVEFKEGSIIGKMKNVKSAIKKGQDGRPKIFGKEEEKAITDAIRFHLSPQ